LIATEDRRGAVIAAAGVVVERLNAAPQGCGDGEANQKGR
jgi:hypothetical protein